MTELIKLITSGDIAKFQQSIKDKDTANRCLLEVDGCTVLHLVAGINHENKKDEMLSYLLEIGADPNARSWDYFTPVHIAAMWNNCKELEQLLKHGGNPWLTDTQRRNAFDLAINNHAYEAYQLLNIYLSEGKLNYRNTDARELSSCARRCANSSRTISDNAPLYFSSSEESGCTNIDDYLDREFCEDKRRVKIDLNRNLIGESSSTETVPKTAATDVEAEMNKAFLAMSINNTAAVGDSFEVILETDNESGVVLIEKCASDSTSVKSDTSVASDWKTCRSNCSVDTSMFVQVPEELQKLSNSKIYRELLKFGDKPGPVLDSTRATYLARLAKLKSGITVPSLLPQLKYSTEIYMFLENRLNTSRIQKLLDVMASEFSCFNSFKKWREGSQRCSFNYFLLDPRVTQNLPLRAQEMPFEKAFLTFIDALFYIGKGRKARPYSHLIDAAKASTFKLLTNEKFSQIMDIWEAGHGVISLHCFQNCIPVEAYTQEACMIEAIRLDNLTNVKKGDYYGKCAEWKKQWKRQVGVVLLHKAFQIFCLEGEKQIMTRDIRK